MNGTLPCVDFMDVIMGDIPYITTLCLNGPLSCVEFMDVIMGDIPYVAKLGFPHSRLYAFSSNSDNIVYHPP